MSSPDFEAGYAAGQRDMRNRARQVVTALAHSGGATFGEVARAIGALPIAAERKGTEPAMPPIEMERIIAEVAIELGVSRREITGSTQARGPMMARWLAARLGRDLLGLSASEIGRAICRDRTTVTHGFRVLERRLNRSPELQAAKARIIDRMRAQP